MLCVFWITTRVGIFAKPPKSNQKQSKKNTKSNRSHPELDFGFPLLGAPPAPEGLVLVHAATKDRYLFQFYKGNPFTMQIVHAYFECRDHIFWEARDITRPFYESISSWASRQCIFPAAYDPRITFPARKPLRCVLAGTTKISAVSYCIYLAGIPENHGISWKSWYFMKITILSYDVM